MIGRDGTREQVIAQYAAMLARRTDLQERARHELRGKDLLCWCTGKNGMHADDELVCHAQVLALVANADDWLPKRELHDCGKCGLTLRAKGVCMFCGDRDRAPA